MKIDLKSMSRKELEKLIANIEKAKVKLVGREKKEALAAAEQAAKAHGFSLAEITDVPKATKPSGNATTRPKKPSVPKYANPADTTKTWTGKGRQPEWFKAALESGKTPGQLSI